MLQNELSELEFIEPEDRKFKPHITIARHKQDKSLNIPAENLKINDSASWEVEYYSLMESFMKRGGSEYVILKNYNLSQS